jgi:hypothetical protein
VNRAWAESRGTCVYLGDWHSHPEPVPHPSYVDEADWRRIVRTAKYGQPFLFFVIVGTDEIGVWEYGFQARHPKRLALLNDAQPFAAPQSSGGTGGMLGSGRPHWVRQLAFRTRRRSSEKD